MSQSLLSKYERTYGGLNQKRERQENRDLPSLPAGRTMGNNLKSTGGRVSTATGRRHSSASSSVSHEGRPVHADNFKSRSPQFAGKSSNSTTTLKAIRRNSSDSGYNSSGKGYEPRSNNVVKDPLNLRDDKYSKSGYSEPDTNVNFSSKPETYQVTATSGSRRFELDSKKSNSYFTDRSMLPISVSIVWL